VVGLGGCGGGGGRAEARDHLLDAGEPGGVLEDEEDGRGDRDQPHRAEPLAGKTCDPQGAQGTGRHDDGSPEIVAEHDGDEGEDHRDAGGDQHLAPVVDPGTGTGECPSEEEGEGEFEELRGLDEDGDARDVHPVGVPTLGGAHGGQHQALEDEGGDENAHRRTPPDAFGHHLCRSGHEERHDDDGEGAQEGEVGVLSLGDVRHRRGGETHEEAEHGEDQGGDDDEVVGDHR